MSFAVAQLQSSSCNAVSIKMYVGTADYISQQGVHSSLTPSALPRHTLGVRKCQHVKQHRCLKRSVKEGAAPGGAAV